MLFETLSTKYSLTTVEIFETNLFVPLIEALAKTSSFVIGQIGFAIFTISPYLSTPIIFYGWWIFEVI